jgi:hypothetical protein
MHNRILERLYVPSYIEERVNRVPFLPGQLAQHEYQLTKPGY